MYEMYDEKKTQTCRSSHREPVLFYFALFMWKDIIFPKRVEDLKMILQLFFILGFLLSPSVISTCVHT